MTAAIRIPTHTPHDSFAADLSVSARAGLTSGLTLGTDPALAAEIAYRRERIQARQIRRSTRRDRDDGNAGDRRSRTVTRWISWLQSDRRHHSSAAHAS